MNAGDIVVAYDHKLSDFSNKNIVYIPGILIERIEIERPPYVHGAHRAMGLDVDSLPGWSVLTADYGIIRRAEKGLRPINEPPEALKKLIEMRECIDKKIKELESKNAF